MSFVLLLVSFLASVAGAICGIGGGVVIKPVLDSLHIAPVATISFLSGCTVLGMSCYSVCKSLAANESRVDFRTGTPLAIGAALGGVAGKNLFDLLREAAADPERIGGFQAACLAIITLAALIYTLCRKSIRTFGVRNAAACAAIGLALGLLSSFLGIGGGPVNLVVLYFFFSMDTKAAAQNSLYIILISQFTSLLTTLITRSIPAFPPIWMVLMTAGGVMGGMAGRVLNKRLNDVQVRKLFIALMAVIIMICCYNAWRFLAA